MPLRRRIVRVLFGHGVFLSAPAVSSQAQVPQIPPAIRQIMKNIEQRRPPTPEEKKMLADWGKSMSQGSGGKGGKADEGQEKEEIVLKVHTTSQEQMKEQIREHPKSSNSPELNEVEEKIPWHAAKAVATLADIVLYGATTILKAGGHAALKDFTTQRRPTMKKTALFLLGLLCLSIPAAAEPDKPGCKDHPLFPTRMPEYFILQCRSTEYDKYEFFSAKGPNHAEEGKATTVKYQINNGKEQQSVVAVLRNYENALKKLGGTIAARDSWRINGKVVVDGREVWVETARGNGYILLNIIEKTAMEQHIVADAASFGNDLKSTGHAAVYGILFDTGKADIKPESALAIGEVAKLLKDDAGLMVFVVGHTDTVGSVDANLKLSQARAEAVVQTLVREHGIAAARLKSFGNGPFAPVASNNAEDGRAKNRRVELVQQ